MAGIDVGLFYFILIQSQWPPQETPPPSIGQRNGLPSSWPPGLASWPPKLASSENLNLILIQSPWPHYANIQSQGGVDKITIAFLVKIRLNIAWQYSI